MSLILTIIISVVLSLALVWRLVNTYRWKRAEEERGRTEQFETISTIVSPVVQKPCETIGVEHFTGWFEGLPVDIKLVTDTLALRKLPGLWLMVTLHQEVAVTRQIDCMFRPAGTASFSNFHLLEKVIRPPAFINRATPQWGVQIRSDHAGAAVELEPLSALGGIFSRPELKELLITSRGIRFVVLLDEADRARYGVMRQVKFHGNGLEAEKLHFWLSHLVKIHDILSKSLAQPGHNQEIAQ